MSGERPRAAESIVRVALGVAAIVTLSAISAPQGVAGPAPEASAHLSEIVSVLERQWLFRAAMDWTDFKRRLFERAGDARTIPDTYEAIRESLSMLGDRHSYYVRADGGTLFSPQSPTQSTGECTVGDPPAVAIPSDVGYVRIQITPAISPAAIQDALRRGVSSKVVGWIVDLRNSRGGNMWPALASIGPLLGEGVSGFFVDAAQQATPWGYAGGAAFLGSNWIELTTTPVELAPGARVALLTDAGVASSGEAIAVAFRTRPHTRSFGTATCGLSTAVNQFPLKTGGRIGVVVAVMADRAKTPYGSKLVPDEVIEEPARLVARAVDWVRAKSSTNVP